MLIELALLHQFCLVTRYLPEKLLGLGSKNPSLILPYWRRGEFPSPLEHEFHISSDATRYYKSGKSFLYRYLPFWMASLANRIIVVFVPIVVVLIPGLRIIPAIFRWRIMLRFYRWYRELMVLERDMLADLAPEKREELLARLDDIDKEVNKMKVPASFAYQFYDLRVNISFVHDRLMDKKHSH